MDKADKDVDDDEIFQKQQLIQKTMKENESDYDKDRKIPYA